MLEILQMPAGISEEGHKVNILGQLNSYEALSADAARLAEPFQHFYYFWIFSICNYV